LYPVNTGAVSHGSEVRQGMVWRWGEREVYYGVPALTLLGEMFSWKWNMARPAQGSSDGWVADKPMSGLGRTPTPEQK